MGLTTCWLKQFDPEVQCNGRIQRCHLIELQRLKRAGLSDFQSRWDVRVWKPGCERHHTRLDRRFFHLKLEDYPPELIDFATEYGFYWGGERRGWRAEYQEVAA